MNRIGLDAGTYNLVVCHKDKDDKFVFNKEVNAFIEVALEHKFMFNMLKNSGVPLIEREKIAYAVGESAVSIAYSLPDIELKRPMASGCVNPKEKDAYKILQIMIHSLIGEIEQDQTILYYSVPANAIDKDTDADHHQKVLDSIFKSYNVNNKKLQAYPINEALALVYAEAQNQAFTAIGVSFGSGMRNICYAKFGMPVFAFSLANSGDWIDAQTAKATGESPVFINQEKLKLDLTATPTTTIERALHIQYQLLIEQTVKGIKDGITQAGNKARSEKPIDFIIAGGVSGPKGFEDLFREALNNADLPIAIGNIRKPKDYLNAVARGCLVAAENSQN